MSQPLTLYPTFRTALPLAAGIFLSETLGWGLQTDSRWTVATGACLATMYILSRWWNYTHRYLFGISVTLFMGCLGVRLAQHQRSRTMYDWPSEKAVYTGVVADTPQEKAKTSLCKVQVENGWHAGRWHSVHRTVHLYVSKDSLSKQLQRGDRLRFYARISRPKQVSFPGSFDYATYLFRQGISGTAVVFPHQWHIFGERKPLSLRLRALARRESILASYRRRGFSGDEFALLSALTLGYKDALSDELQDAYRTAGAGHILALSGLHVAILWGLLGGLTRPLARKRWSRWTRCALIVCALWGFAFLTGWPTSAVRAVIMCMWITVSQAAGIRTRPLNALGVTAFFMLLYNPFYLFDTGFQLSFLAVLSILAAYPLIFRWLVIRHPLLRHAWSLVAVSLAAQWGTCPLVLHHFAYFPVHFLLANLLAAPLACLAIYGAVATFVFSPLPFLHVWAVKGVNGVLRILNSGMQWIEGLPFARAGNMQISALQAYVLYAFSVLLLACCLQRNRRWFIALLSAADLFLLLVLCQNHFYREKPQLLFDRSQVKAYPQAATWQRDGIYRYKGTTVCIVTDNRWQNKTATRLLDLDYIYLCRNYRGDIAPLQKLFRIKKVILDASLNDSDTKRWKAECEQSGLDYAEAPVKEIIQGKQEIR